MRWRWLGLKVMWMGEQRSLSLGLLIPRRYQAFWQVGIEIGEELDPWMRALPPECGVKLVQVSAA
jgi:hypothetical protein